jgi:uncharacterized membrane protein
MKTQKDVKIGIIVAIIGFLASLLIACIITYNKDASIDGWLGFLGGLFGSFISGMITFFVLYINREDMQQDEIMRQKNAEMEKMEEYLRDAFISIRSGQGQYAALSNFILIKSLIKQEYQKIPFYKTVAQNEIDLKNGMVATVINMEQITYKQFIEYKHKYLES